MFASFAILFFAVPAYAQHGTAISGYFPSNYQGDLWTGVVSSVVPATREVSLVYTHHGKTTVFEGILSKTCRVQVWDSKEKRQIAASGITVGAHLKVYYMPNRTSDDVSQGPFPFKAFNLLEGSLADAPRRFNLIFLIEFLPEQNENRTGVVISTNDSARTIKLEVANGARSEVFVGVLMEGYQIKMKDGEFHDLLVSQIPAGARIKVHYFDEVIGTGRAAGEVHRIYRIEFLSSPQNP